ncbi:MAG: hypothetical protein PHP85_06880 [Gallionella sp.]|nr:hypothetical protein [Gallionella sp.]
MNKEEVALLSEEVEMLMQERAMLLKVAGAAAILISHASVRDLPEELVASADELSMCINALREDTLKDALDAAKGE